MKKSIVIAALALAFVTAAGATEPVSPPAASASAVEELSDQLQAAREQIADLEKRLGVVEQRLGDTYQTPTPFDTIEKRLEDVEEGLDDLKRR